MLYEDSKLNQFQIILKPDLSAASLHVISIEVAPHDLGHVSFEDYRICEDTLVSCWMNSRLDQYQSGVYTELLTSARFANDISQCGPAAKMLLPGAGQRYYFSLCPASGRLVYLDSNDNLVVSDIF